MLISFFGALLSALYLIPASLAINPGFDYGSSKTKVRGVNLGGWLVLEPWITPSIFENSGDNRIIDELTFGMYMDHSAGTKILKAHWDSWITEFDFERIAQAGLNHVRIPIGYWAFDVSGGERYIQGQLPYLEKAISWAKLNKLKVIINLHGVPGSQNGFDNSGNKSSDPSWYQYQSNVNRSLAIIQQLADTYKDETSTVTAIGVLNEPKVDGPDQPHRMDVLKQYWYDSYGIIRYPYLHESLSRESNTMVIISNAFQPLDVWKGFMPPPHFQGVIMDIHRYQMFTTDEVNRGDVDHISAACSEGREISKFSKSYLWTIVGEWTPAATDCAKFLNGRHVGARYEGTYSDSDQFLSINRSCKGLTGDASTFSSDYKKFLREYWETQTFAYEQALGWIQWTWKTESADEWSYKAGLKHGWIPQNPEDRNSSRCGDALFSL